MKKKLLVFVLAVIMVFSTMSVAAFAEEGQAVTYPNLSIGVSVDNPDCIHYDDAKVSVKITKNDLTVASIDLNYDKEWGQYSFEGRQEGIDAIIDEIAGNESLMKEYSDWMADLNTEEDFDILAKAGYEVEVIAEDNDANHDFEVYGLESSIATKELIEETTDAIANMVVMMIINSSSAAEIAEVAVLFGGVNLVAKEGTAYIVYADNTEKAVGFNDLLDLVKNEDVAKEMELEDDDIAAIKEYEDMMAAMEAGTYKGELDIYADLKCGCQVMNEYTLYHEYYDADGKYIAQVSSDVKAAEGTVVKVEDLKLIEKYDGENYKFDGVYLYNEKNDEWDWANPITEFTVPLTTSDEYLSVCIKYVSTSSGVAGDSEPEGEGGKADGSNPDTGDDFNVLPFAAVMLLAVAGMGAAVVRRRA